MFLFGLMVLTVIRLEFTFSKFPVQHGLGGVQLKFVTSHFSPFDLLTTEPDGNITHTGICPPFYAWLGKKLNFTISYMIIDDKIAAKYGSTTKMFLQLLLEKKVDATSMGFIITPERKKKFDFAYFMWAETYNMVVPVPGEEPRLFAFIRPFQPNAWILILMTMIFMTGSMSLFSKIYSSNIFINLSGQTMSKISLLEYANRYFLYVVNIMTNQGGGHYNNRFSFRILVGVWLLVATVIVNCYSGTVISYLTVPKNKPKINSFEDLAASNEIGVIIRGDFVIGQQILEAKTGVLKILGDQARRNPKQLAYKTDEILDLLRTGHYAFPFLRSSCTSFIGNQFKTERKCRFAMTDPLSMYGYWAVTLQKDSEFTAIFNDALIELWETGLPWYWGKINTPQAPPCFAKVKARANSAHLVAIKLTDLMGAFLILGVGIGISTFTFVLERTFPNCAR